MANTNIVIVAGNLTRDPELRYTPQAAAVCDFCVANNRKWKAKDGTLKEDVAFIDVVTWAKTAENAAKYLKKGSSVLVEGRLTQDRWEKDGKKYSRIKVVAESVQFLSRATGGEPGAPAPADAGAGGSGEEPPF